MIRACLAGGAASYVEAKDVKTGLRPPLSHRLTPEGGAAPSTQCPVSLWQWAEVQAVLWQILNCHLVMIVRPSAPSDRDGATCRAGAFAYWCALSSLEARN